LKITAEFVTSAAGAEGLPTDGRPEVALVGRSNVGKSSLINALARRAIARTSAAPGKTRLLNVYLVQRGSAPPLYLVDLPGYGYARGGDESAREFAALTQAYFSRGQDPTLEAEGRRGDRGELGRDAASAGQAGALLLVDVRHPGLDSDVAAWRWMEHSVARAAVVATKVDKLARGQRIRAIREIESVFERSVLPVSAVTGEGLDELWTLIDRLANSRNPNPPLSPSRPKATAHRPPRK
jgi:GTP-binding protein